MEDQQGEPDRNREGARRRGKKKVRFVV